jgi:hypothetical protein
MAWILALATAYLAMLGCALLFFRGVARADQRLAEALRAWRKRQQGAPRAIKRAIKRDRSNIDTSGE